MPSVQSVPIRRLVTAVILAYKIFWKILLKYYRYILQCILLHITMYNVWQNTNFMFNTKH